ncbi:unnamed protein product [Rangifer tarandus platyrhynchus]|uniref:Uncharacterized protein n=1 Tax=Rangifer tarandus platyrhynchus TaxID=3082113 RepID=A0AC59ZS42_RANTA
MASAPWDQEPMAGEYCPPHTSPERMVAGAQGRWHCLADIFLRGMQVTRAIQILPPTMPGKSSHACLSERGPLMGWNVTSDNRPSKLVEALSAAPADALHSDSGMHTHVRRSSPVQWPGALGV